MVLRFSIYAGGLVLVVISATLVSAGLTSGILAIGVVAVAVAMVWVGPEKVGFGFLGLAFMTAPFFSGFVPLAGVATPPDFFLALATVALLPRILVGHNKFDPIFPIGILLFLAAGIVSSIGSEIPVLSAIGLIQVLICIAAIPIVIASLHLDRVAVQRFAWAFVAGQLLSILFAFAQGPVGDGGRYDGLTSHPNAFGQSGMLSFALLLHLLTTTRRKWFVYAAMALCLGSVYLSGSRAATLTVAALIMLIPVVERSALVGYLVAFAGVGAAVGLQFLLSRGESGGSIGRLVGEGSARGSNDARMESLAEGFDRFWQHPVRGNGFLDLFMIHNNYLEIAVAAGVIGLTGYLMVVWSVTRGILGSSPLRRLSYPAAAYSVLALTIPSLTDRSIWMAIALSFALFRGFKYPPSPDPEEPELLSERSKSVQLGRRGPPATTLTR